MLSNNYPLDILKINAHAITVLFYNYECINKPTITEKHCKKK